MNRKFYVAIPLLISLVLPAKSQVRQSALEERLKEVTAGKKAQIGVAVIINGKDTVCINNDVMYPMMSVFKFHQALSVLHCLEQRDLPLTTAIHISPSDLHPDTYSPLRDKYPQGGITMSIEELLTYTLQLSDNNACDILFDYIGGVEQTDSYIRSLGFDNFSISASEDDMHRDPKLCYLNRTTPLDAAKLLEKLISGDILTDSGRAFIIHAMIRCETGQDRLPKPLLGTDAVIGHKTGTGDRDAAGRLTGTNDIGFVILPNGQRYTIAVFVKESEESVQATAQTIAAISAVVYRHMTSAIRQRSSE